MNFPSHLPLLAAVACAIPAHGIVVRNYNSSQHDRFSEGFPNAPVMNPNFIHDASKFTGVGWWWVNGTPAASDTQLTLISPRHVLSVRHHELNFASGTQSVRFVASDGQVHTRVVGTFNSITNGATLVDLAVSQLSSLPLPVTVKPVRYRNNLTEENLEGDSIIVLGKNAVSGSSVTGGSSVILDFGDQPYAPNYITRMFEFEYEVASGNNDDCYYGPGPGDSSSPVFVEYNNEPALVGVAAGATVVANAPYYYGYCTFVPPYITQINAILSPMGYRMRPAEYTATTLNLASALSPGTPRQAHPGSVAFTLGNTGGQTTGNVAITLAFNPAEAPSSVSVPGWVVDSLGGGVWSIRKAVMSAGDSIVATATWTALPTVASLAVNVTVESDTTTTSNTVPAFTLLPSYAAWAAGLTEAAETDDPDDDALENLLEYAFGGDAENGTMLLPGGHPLQPELSVAGGSVTLSYPERSDVGVRGLSYVVETSADLDDLAGSTTLPAGAVSTTAAYSPAEPGFVKRTITWPSDGPLRFARVKVALAE